MNRHVPWSVLKWSCVAAALLSGVAWIVSLVTPIGPTHIGALGICATRGYVLLWTGWSPGYWEWSRASACDVVPRGLGLGWVLRDGTRETGMWIAGGGDIRITHWTALRGVPLWLPFVAASVAGLLLVGVQRKHKPGRCSSCGYNLTGNVSGRCPECGAVVGRASR